MKLGICFLHCVFGFRLIAEAQQLTVTSPSGAAVFQLETGGTDGTRFSITYRGKTAIEKSALGITVDGRNSSANASIVESTSFRVDESYPWNGVKAKAVDRCNGSRIAMRGSNGAFTIEVRAYDDGVAFRHTVPGTGRRVPGEATAFRPPEGSIFWFHDLEDHYEAYHVRESTRSVAPGAWMAFPVLIGLPQQSGYAVITEGALRNYSGAALQADSKANFVVRLAEATPASYPFRLRYPDDVARFTAPAAVEGPISTPGRIVMLGADFNSLANNDIVHNVAPPPDSRLFPQGIQTDWIKPGRAVWSYLDGGERTLAGSKEFSRLAGELGFEYNIIEGFWTRWSEAELKELTAESRKRGVGVILWKHSNQLRTAENRKAFFDLCQRNGVAGAKIDFFDHEHKEIIDLYEELLRGAAEHKLLIDFHGSNKPTGMERTWPNLIGLEGIRGMETRPPYAEHEVVLPFTRMLAGMADYTPMHFAPRKFADTTWAHQIANAILLPAPLLAYAAHPSNILSNPAVELIRAIPAVWDETVVLTASEVGEVAAIARRRGGDWFLAVNNGVIERELDLTFSFLGPGSYNAMLVADSSTAASVAIERKAVTSASAVKIKLRSGGGFVARFRK